MRLSRSMALALGLALCGGCGGTARREAAALQEAVDRYRRAPGDYQPDQSQAIAALSCSDRAVCDAKRACLDAVEPTDRALQLTGQVAAAVRAIESRRMDPHSSAAQALPEKLGQAKALLQVGRERMQGCDRKLADLRLRYAL